MTLYREDKDLSWSIDMKQLTVIFRAHKIGIKAAWINRPQAIMGVRGHDGGQQPDLTFSSMIEFTDEMELVKSGI